MYLKNLLCNVYASQCLKDEAHSLHQNICFTPQIDREKASIIVLNLVIGVTLGLSNLCVDTFSI